MTARDILLCTVGTGNVNDIEKSLLTPLKKSIRRGSWAKVVLLPSQVTLTYAERLRDELPNVAIDIKPLERPTQEDDPDACFAHFDQVLADLLLDGASPPSLVADFTRGTKAMSAALVLAAVRHGLPVVRYIAGEQRDSQGMVVAGTENVTEIRTTIATARRLIDNALVLFCQGNFSAVFGLLTNSNTADWTNRLARDAEALSCLARFFAAWDRLDYAAAASISHDFDLFSTLGSETTLPRTLSPPAEVIDWVRSLAETLPEACREKAEPLRRILIDLFANGERRLRDHLYEDALLRAYRVLELLGQVRLLDQGYDSAALPPDDERIKTFQEALLKKKSEPLTSNRNDGLLQAPREKVARLLKHLGDDFGQRLINAAEAGEVKARTRNQSVLIHGFDSVAGSEQQPLIALYQRLENLVVDDCGTDQSSNKLATARFPDFGPRHS